MVNMCECEWNRKICNIDSWLSSLFPKKLAGKSLDIFSLTLGHFYIFPVAGQSAVDLSNEFHVVKK